MLYYEQGWQTQIFRLFRSNYKALNEEDLDNEEIVHILSNLIK